jgi:hypothetical protein
LLRVALGREPPLGFVCHVETDPARGQTRLCLPQAKVNNVENDARRQLVEHEELVESVDQLGLEEVADSIEYLAPGYVGDGAIGVRSTGLIKRSE